MSNFFTWTSDAASGTWVNSAYSANIRKAAIAQTLGMKFVTPENGYGKNKGESVDIQRFSKLTVPTTGQLSEFIDIPIDKMTAARTRITVAEWGRGVEVTEKSVDLSYFKLTDVAEFLLKDQMSQILDTAVWAAFRTNKTKYIPTGAAAGTFDTDGTASTTATANFNMFHLAKIRDYASDTLNMPTFRDGKYICVLGTQAARGIKSDPSWINYHLNENAWYAGINGVLGEVENTILIECNNTTAFRKVGTASVLGEAMFFGADAVSQITALDPEMRYTTAGGGRFRAVLWYGLLNFGLVWPTATAGEERVIHVTSA